MLAAYDIASIKIIYRPYCSGAAADGVTGWPGMSRSQRLR
jgi:hypothetical protein